MIDGRELPRDKSTFTEMKNDSTTAPKSKLWLLAKSRQWHLWGGLFAGLFIVLAGASGIVLNYKKPIFNALGLESNFPKSVPESKAKSTTQPAVPPVRLTTDDATTTATAVIMQRALTLARAEWGETRLERIELKDEHGELLCKVKNVDGAELWLDAVTGNHFLKGEFEKIGKKGADGMPVKQFDWGKVILDFHTGKIGGEVGKVIMSLAALMLVFLTASGVYMWLKPVLIRRKNAKAKALVVGQPPVTGTPATVRSPKPALVEA